MTKNRDTLEKLGRFLLRGLRIGASTVSIVELLRNDWTGGISARRSRRLCCLRQRCAGGRHRAKGCRRH